MASVDDQPQISKLKRCLEDASDLEPAPKRRKTDLDNDNNNNMNTVNTETVIVELSNILNEIEEPTNLSIGGKCNSLPLIPELIVDEIGRIPLPVSDHQLPLLIDKCNKSSFGHGLKTENDENVRKSYELTADKFKFVNPSWNKGIKKLVKHSAIKLGCNQESIQNVVAHCYKLIIYEVGGHFIEHRDTQKIDGMFATLVIQLPSIYTNINNKPTLIVKHKTNEYKYYFGTNVNDSNINNSKYNIYYSVHYCDLTHLINKIESGHRMVITYNLCWNGPKDIIPKIGNFDKLTSKIRHILNQWDGNNAIAVNLDHLYTHSELLRDGIKALKGSDAARIQTIMSSVEQENNLRFFISEVTRTIEEYDTGGNCGDWEECERSETVNDEWYATDGKIFKFGKYFNIDLEKHCIGYDEDEEWEEIDQTQEGYLGNEGATQSTTYSKYIAIFFKSENQFDLLLNGDNGIEAGLEWINYLLNKKQNILSILSYIKIIINKFNANSYTDKSQIISILKLLKNCGNLQLIKQFINKLIEHNIGLKYGNSSYSYSYSYHSSSSSQKNCVEILSEIIIKYGWIEPIKSITLKWCDCLLTDDYNDIHIYCQLPILIKGVIDKMKLNKENNNNSNTTNTENKYDDDDDDDDIVILSNKKNMDNIDCSNKYLNECYNDLTNKLWEIIKIKIDLKGNNKIIGKLNAKNIECIIKLMIEINCNVNDEQLLFDKIYKENVKQNVQKQIVEKIKLWQNKLLISNECIQSIINHRIYFLREEIEKGEPIFSWRMSCEGSGYHTDFANFLKSDKQTFTKTGFNGIGHARNWARKYSKSSINNVSGGRGNSAYVVVTKNRNYFNSLKREYQQKIDELKSLILLLTNN